MIAVALWTWVLLGLGTGAYGLVRGLRKGNRSETFVGAAILGGYVALMVGLFF